MVKNYLIATMLLFASAAMAQGTYPPLLKNRVKAHLEEKGDGAIWRPGTYVISTMNDNEWQNEEHVTSTYDSNGNATTIFTEKLMWTPESSTKRYSYYVNTFNSYGNLLAGVTSFGNDKKNLEEAYKYEYTYDEVVPDFVTSDISYFKIDGVWTKDYRSSKNDVTRDEKGRVTEVVKYRMNQKGEYITSEKDVITYGEDGKPSQIKVYQYYEDNETGEVKLAQAIAYTDIVWKNCDNQILNGHILFQGANRILSAKIIVNDAEHGSIKVEYGPGEKDYTVIEEATPQGLSIKTINRTEWREINPYDSYSILNRRETYSKNSDEPEVSVNYESVTNDAYGYLIERINRNENNGVITSFYKEIGEVEYDKTYGYPLVYTVSRAESMDGSEPVPVPGYRMEFSDYKNCRETTGIDNVAVENNDNAPVEYFNLQGERINKPSKGLYIRRQGKLVQKSIAKD